MTARGTFAETSEKRPACRVLVVEDEALICVETADTLEHQGFQVHTALRGEDAIRRLRDGLPVEILFTDINLGGAMDGLTLARLARELFPDLVVVYTSGTIATIPDPIAGAVFVPKPYNPDRIARLLTDMTTAGARDVKPGQPLPRSRGAQPHH